MKIITTVSKKSDDISLSGSILTVNGNDYDLNKAPDYIHPTEDNSNPDNGIIFKADDEVFIHLNADVDRQFMFINGNDKKFYDKDCNNLIDLSELKVIVDHWNMTEAERRAEHKKILNK